MRLQESGEMYLETILILSRQGGTVRSVDVAESMGFSKPSVSRAVGVLRQGGYLTVEDAGELRLTPKGLEIATKIYARHNLLTELLVRLGVDRQTAATDACRMEHTISDTTFEALRRHLEAHPDEAP